MLNPHEVIFNFLNWKFHVPKGSFPRGESSGFPGSKLPMLRGVVQPFVPSGMDVGMFFFRKEDPGYVLETCEV